MGHIYHHPILYLYYITKHGQSQILGVRQWEGKGVGFKNLFRGFEILFRGYLFPGGVGLL
jgi:hypothetical protein